MRSGSQQGMDQFCPKPFRFREDRINEIGEVLPPLDNAAGEQLFTQNCASCPWVAIVGTTGKERISASRAG